MADQADPVALGVAQEGHLFGAARRPERVVDVAEDDVRLGEDLHPVRPQGLDGHRHVLDAEVDQGAGHVALEQQPYRADPKKRESRRVEAPRGLGTQQLGENVRPARGPRRAGPPGTPRSLR